MGVFRDTREAFRRGLSGNDVYERGGHKVACSICGNTHFNSDLRLLSTSGLSFLGLDFANAKAEILICKKCGHIEWFVHDIVLDID